jgi:hypothetical protein
VCVCVCGIQFFEGQSLWTSRDTQGQTAKMWRYFVRCKFIHKYSFVYTQWFRILLTP